MYEGKKVVVVMPAYNVAQTLSKTYQEIPHSLVDEIVLTDDASKNNITDIARQLVIVHVIRHEKNLGYGGIKKRVTKKHKN